VLGFISNVFNGACYSTNELYEDDLILTVPGKKLKNKELKFFPRFFAHLSQFLRQKRFNLDTFWFFCSKQQIYMPLLRKLFYSAEI
jgi:hypothetical protein